jgi:hypothetical protein
VGAVYYSCTVAKVGLEPDVIMECTGVRHVIAESLLAMRRAVSRVSPEAAMAAPFQRSPQPILHLPLC